MSFTAPIEFRNFVVLGGFRLYVPSYVHRSSDWRGWDMSDVPWEWRGLPEAITRRGEWKEPLKLDPLIHYRFAALPYKITAYLKFSKAFGQMSFNGPENRIQKFNPLDFRGVWRGYTFLEWGLLQSHLRIFLGMPLNDEPRFVEKLRWKYSTEVEEKHGKRIVHQTPVELIDSATYLQSIAKYSLEASYDGVLRPLHLYGALALNALH